MREATEQYDIIFMNVFSEQFFPHIRHILHDHGCCVTNSSSPKIASHRLMQVLSSIFEANVSFAYNNEVGNARIIISGSKPSIAAIASKEQAVQRAQQLESNAHLEFSLSRSLSLVHHDVLLK